MSNLNKGQNHSIDYLEYNFNIMTYYDIAIFYKILAIRCIPNSASKYTSCQHLTVAKVSALNCPAQPHQQQGLAYKYPRCIKLSRTYHKRSVRK